MSLFLRRCDPNSRGRDEEERLLAEQWLEQANNLDAGDGDGVEEVVGWRSLFRLRPGMTRRDVVGVVVVLALIVAVCFPLGVGLQLWWDSRQEREPQPWETSLASGHTPRPTTPAPSASASASASASSALSAEEQALREVALATPAPERPAGMDQFTPEGAIAAVGYFLSLYPYAHATGDLSQWQAMSDPECEFCNNVVNRVTEMHEAGGWWDPWQQELTLNGYGETTDDSSVWVVSVTISYQESMKHDGTGESTPTSPDTASLLIQMRWTGQSWVVEVGQAA